MQHSVPYRTFPIDRWEGEGRPVSHTNGCKIHTNVCDVIVWPDGDVECMVCARDRQLPTESGGFKYIKDYVK